MARTYAGSLIWGLQGFLQAFVELETSLVSMERVLAYTELAPEAGEQHSLMHRPLGVALTLPGEQHALIAREQHSRCRATRGWPAGQPRARSSFGMRRCATGRGCLRCSSKSISLSRYM